MENKNSIFTNIIIGIVFCVLSLLGGYCYYIQAKNDGIQMEKRLINWIDTSKNDVTSLLVEYEASLNEKLSDNKENSEAIIAEESTKFRIGVEQIFHNNPINNEWKHSTPIISEKIDKEWESSAPIDSSGDTKKWEPSMPLSTQ